MLLSDILSSVEYVTLKGDVDIAVSELIYDSRKAAKGDVFVCISGTVRDAHDFIPDVISKGVAAVIVEKDIDLPNENVTIVKVTNCRKALALMSAAFFGNPAKDLITIGITGTKGKTTTTYMIKNILDRAGISTGLIGTIEAIIGDEHIHAENTTPESYTIQKYFRKMADCGIKAVVMEVSSQGLMLNRVAGITFDYGIFTNLEPDHIGDNEHKDFEDYMYWKSTLFQKCKVGIMNADSEHLEGILKGHTCEVVTFGISKAADVKAENISFLQKDGLLETGYTAVTTDSKFEVTLNMPGVFSVYNSLTAIALCKQLGVSDEIIAEALTKVAVTGRTEIVPVSELVNSGFNYTVMIDYAHNAMALESLLTTLKAYNPKRIVCIFGCGGNRSKSRRYEMGEVSSRLADFTIVTSDNPRFEEPEDIIADIITGVKKADGEYITIPDRQEAVTYAIKNARPGDVIVLAGKGHEDYQEIKGVKYHMDEHELIYNSLK